ncbi:MAG: hypothetical protein QMC90_04275 [Dehalococcoidales bacterium]|nr:hypothetical protein [Dehalococcoidales bacterium]
MAEERLFDDKGRPIQVILGKDEAGNPQQFLVKPDGRLIIAGHQNVYSQLLGADLTAAQSITLDVAGRTLLNIYALADAATTFRLDVSTDNTNWITNYLTWAAVTEVKETHTIAFRYLRLKSDAAGVAGNLVSLYLTAGR